MKPSQLNPTTYIPRLGFQEGAAMGLPPQEDTCELVRKAAQAEGRLGLAIQRLSGIELAPTPTDEGVASPGADA